MTYSKKIFYTQNITADGLGNGYLYNWFAASDANFAPTDWRVPTSTEWFALRNFIGDFSVAGGPLKETGLVHWNTPNTSATDTYGFSAFGSGYRGNVIIQDNTFNNMKDNGYYWGSDTAQYRALFLRYDSNAFTMSATPDTYGLSVKLIYTGAGTPTTVTDYDGNIYDVVVINGIRYTVQNWKCTHFKNGTPYTKVTDNATWIALTSEGYCAYDNNEANV